MTQREKFIKFVEYGLIQNINPKDYPDEIAYFNKLKNQPEKEVKILTENGAAILRFMQEKRDQYNNVFTSKSIGENIGKSSRTVSGSMKKLVTDGFVEKISADPVTYGISEKGINFDIDSVNLTK